MLRNLQISKHSTYNTVKHPLKVILPLFLDKIGKGKSCENRYAGILRMYDIALKKDPAISHI